MEWLVSTGYSLKPSMAEKNTNTVSVKISVIGKQMASYS
jgi:hypothetical protein